MQLLVTENYDLLKIYTHENPQSNHLNSDGMMKKLLKLIFNTRIKNRSSDMQAKTNILS